MLQAPIKHELSHENCENKPVCIPAVAARCFLPSTIRSKFPEPGFDPENCKRHLVSPVEQSKNRSAACHDEGRIRCAGRHRFSRSTGKTLFHLRSAGRTICGDPRRADIQKNRLRPVNLCPRCLTPFFICSSPRRVIGVRV